MELFLAKLPYIIVSAGVISLLAGVWAFIALRNEKDKGSGASRKTDGMCRGCSMADICMSRKSGSCEHKVGQ